MVDIKAIPQEILDNLPMAISVQTNHREVIYENSAMKSIFGDHTGRKCYQRWDYLVPKGIPDICIDCPGKISLEDQKEHSILRKTKDKDGNDLFIKITHIPLTDQNDEVTRFIEVVHNMTIEEKKIIALKQMDKIDDIHLTLTRFGKLGGETISYTDNNILDSNLKRIQLTVFWFASIGQGNNFNHGFFGPLPLLDEMSHISYAYSFSMNCDNGDPRFKGKEILLLLIATDRYNDKLFNKREIIFEYLNKYFESYNRVEEIKYSDMNDFKNQFIEFLKYKN